MTMTFTTHRDLPVCRNLSIGFLAKLPPCHSKGKIWWMLQSGSMKKLLAAITGLKSGLGCGKNSKIFEDYVVQYMFIYFMKLNLSQLIQKSPKFVFLTCHEKLAFKKKSPTQLPHILRRSFEVPTHLPVHGSHIVCSPSNSEYWRPHPSQSVSSVNLFATNFSPAKKAGTFKSGGSVKQKNMAWMKNPRIFPWSAMTSTQL